MSYDNEQIVEWYLFQIPEYAHSLQGSWYDKALNYKETQSEKLMKLIAEQGNTGLCQEVRCSLG